MPEYPDIAAFVVAQLDRLEGLAKACGVDETGRWLADADKVKWASGTTGELVDLVADTYFDPPVASHIAQHDPAFVLRDIAAKRAILAEHRKAVDLHRRTPDDVGDMLWVFDRVLRLLAAPFAGQPGWQQEWAVGT